MMPIKRKVKVPKPIQEHGIKVTTKIDGEVYSNVIRTGSVKRAIACFKYLYGLTNEYVFTEKV